MALSVAVAFALAELGAALARRLRLFLANATTTSVAGLPMIGLFSLALDACEYPRDLVTASAQLSYAVASTPTVTLVSPHRGSTAPRAR